MDKIKETLNQLWNGDIPLAHTFWLYYFIGMLVLRIPAQALGALGALIIIGWAGYMVLPIWRSADKYTGNKFFALLAKIAAVLIALAVAGSLF
ncbi:MAG: hypothetical protein R3E13_10135 [Alphaproteobacteria bacterium]